MSAQMLLAAYGAAATPSVTHSQSTDTAHGTNRTVTLSHVPDSGKSLIVLIACSTAPGAWNVTDNQGNTYVQDYTTSPTTERYIFRCHNITNAPTTLQLNNPTAIIAYVRIVEVSNLAAAAPATAGGQTSGSNVATLTRSHTAAAANEFVCGWFAGAATATTSDVLPLNVLNVPSIGTVSSFHLHCATVPSAGATDFKQTFTASVSAPRLTTIGYASV